MSKLRQFIATNLARVILSAYFSGSGRALPKINTPFLEACAWKSTYISRLAY